jgi:hypothetical protein
MSEPEQKNNEDSDEIPILPEESDKMIVDMLNTDPLLLTKSEAEMVGVISNAKSKQEEIEQDQVQPIGLYEELSPEDYATAMKEVKKQLIEKDAFNEVKNLEKDMLTVADQNYCVVSWVGPSFKAKTDVCGFRIMGAFKTIEKAQKYAQRLHQVDPTYDIGIMEMYLWCLGYPDASDIIMGPDGQMDTVAMEKERDRKLNEFVVKHKTQLEETKQLFEVRKRAIRKSKITKEGEIEDAPIKEVPLGVPTEEMKAIHDKEAVKWIGESKKPKEEDDDDYELDAKMLDFETAYKIPNQEWAVISFVGYTGTNQRIPICIKGVYPSEEEANNRIKQLIHVDDTYDIVPMPLYKWVPCDPDLSTIKGVFKEKALNNLIEANQKQHEETLSFHQVRKKYVKPEEDQEDSEFEYKLTPAKITFQEPEAENQGDDVEEGSKACAFKQGQEENGEVMNATNAFVESIKFDSEDIRTKGKMYYENNEQEPSEEDDDDQKFTLNLSDKDIKEPMFKKQEDSIKEFEDKIRNIMNSEGITEKEARDRFRLKFDKREEKIYQTEEDIDSKSKAKPKVNGTDLESMAQIVDRLKKEGKTPAEIRKIMSERPTE